MYKIIGFILTFIIGFIVTQRVLAWDHTVIMFPPAGATFTVPLIPEARNCVYVTDCSEALSSPTADPAPPAVAETPYMNGVEGWTFFNDIERSKWAVEVVSKLERG